MRRLVALAVLFRSNALYCGSATALIFFFVRKSRDCGSRVPKEGIVGVSICYTVCSCVPKPRCQPTIECKP